MSKINVSSEGSLETAIVGAATLLALIILVLGCVTAWLVILRGLL